MRFLVPAVLLFSVLSVACGKPSSSFHKEPSQAVEEGELPELRVTEAPTTPHHAPAPVATVTDTASSGPVLSNDATVALDPSLEYKIEGLNSKGEVCSTGHRKSESHKLMCLGLQDPEANNDCALSERIRHFSDHCKDVNFEFYGAHRCEVLMLKKRRPQHHLSGL